MFLDPVTGVVYYRIRAVSWPQSTLARLGEPWVRALQARFRRHSEQPWRVRRADSSSLKECRRQGKRQKGQGRCRIRFDRPTT